MMYQIKKQKTNKSMTLIILIYLCTLDDDEMIKKLKTKNQ